MYPRLIHRPKPMFSIRKFKMSRKWKLRLDDQLRYGRNSGHSQGVTWNERKFWEGSRFKETVKKTD